MEGARVVRAPRGTALSAGSWQTEAPLRMLMNNLDPEVAERPDDLVVYGGMYGQMTAGSWIYIGTQGILLSGDARDIHATDQAVLDMFPDNDHLHRWIRAAQDRVAFQGLPARIHAGGPRCGRERRSRARACWPMRWFAEHALLPGGPARDVATAMEAALGPLREPA